MHSPAEKCTFLQKNAGFGRHIKGNRRKSQEGFRAQDHRLGVCRMHRNDNFVNVFGLVVFYFSAGQSSVFQFITQPPGWCWGQCFPAKCIFLVPRCVCLLLCIQDYKTGKRISRESSSDFASWRLHRRLSGIVLVQVCGVLRRTVAWKE